MAVPEGMVMGLVFVKQPTCGGWPSLLAHSPCCDSSRCVPHSGCLVPGALCACAVHSRRIGTYTLSITVQCSSFSYYLQFFSMSCTMWFNQRLRVERDIPCCWFNSLGHWAAIGWRCSLRCVSANNMPCTCRSCRWSWCGWQQYSSVMVGSRCGRTVGCFGSVRICRMASLEHLGVLLLSCLGSLSCTLTVW